MKTAKQAVPVLVASSKEGMRYFRQLNERRQQRDTEVTAAVTNVIDAVRKEGDKAVLRFTEQFDGVTLRSSTIKITVEEINAAARKIDKKLKVAIAEAGERIRTYHSRQVREGFALNTAEGILMQLIQPLQRVGLYIPGGQAVYPSTVLMDAIPAIVAGVPELVAVTPPRAELDPGIAFALKLLKIKEVYRIGGAQGIATLALGTATIPAVDKIVGPGNIYVQTAKRLLFGTVDIDAIAGPVPVIALAARKY
jgi:histidinol dehydrogenase